MKRFNIEMQFLVIISLLLLLLNGILGWMMVSHARVALKTQIQQRMLDVTNTAASMIDGDKYEKITATNADSEEYRHVHSVLSTFANHIGLEYVYGLRPLEDGSVIFTIDPALVNAAEFGEKAVITDALRQAFNGVPSVCNEQYTDDYGSFYSAYSPVRNSGGDIVGFIVADCDATWYNNQMIRITLTLLGMCVFSLLIGGGIVFLFAEQLRKRFKELNNEMYELSVDISAFIQKVTGSPLMLHNEPDMNILNEKRLKHQSHDEIYELGEKIQVMRDDLREYINKVYSLAFRDPLTGVKSKQAYVEYENMINKMIKDSSIQEFGVAVFDVNGLKKVNDSLGHEAGDTLIKNSCKIICDKFAHSPVFRIGGDEFVAVLKGRDYEMREDLMKSFIAENEESNKKGGVVVAGGIAEYCHGSDFVMQDVFNRADASMYKEKQRLKGCK